MGLELIKKYNPPYSNRKMDGEDFLMNFYLEFLFFSKKLRSHLMKS